MDMRALVDYLNETAYQYYTLGEPTISDAEWDKKYDELRRMEEETGERLGEFGSDQDAADYCDYLGSLGRSVSMVGRNVPENAVRDGQGGWNYYTVDEETGPEYEC